MGIKLKKFYIPLAFLLAVVVIWLIAFASAPGKGKIQDPMLEAAVRKAAERYQGELFPEHYAMVTTLSLRDAGIFDLQGIQLLVNLKELDLRDNQITNLRPLAGLTSLETLNLRGNKITDITPLKDLTMLRHVNLRENQITDISALADMPLLRERLYLRGNPIADYSPIMPYYDEIRERDIDMSVPVFSQEGGFYRSAFPLELKTMKTDVTIYYTLDGSVPSSKSIRYDGPIKIENRERKPNEIAGLLTVVNDWHKPGNVFKGTVVRAIAYDSQGRPSPIITKSYFVHPLGISRYSLPIVSLSTDRDNLFDPATGIYVAGDLYENVSQNPWENPANYTQRGKEWERPAHIEFYEDDGTLGFSEDVGIRIHGAASRSNVLKSLRVLFRKEYGASKLEYPLFPELPYEQFDSFILRTSGNDHDGAYLRDAYMQSLLKDTQLDTQGYRPAILFINGEYWGIHNIRERGDEDYFEEKYGIKSRDLELLEGNGDALAGDNTAYNDLIQYLRSSDITNPDVYDKVKKAIDVINYMDYEIAQIYFDNGDWPGNNIRYWRESREYDPMATYGRDGRFRWFVFDTDFGFGMYGDKNYMTDSLDRAITTRGSDWPNPEWSTFLLRTLLKNDEFRVEFANRFADLLNTSFHPSVVNLRLMEMKSVIEPEMEEHIKRWGRPYGIDHWNKNIENMRTFGQLRPLYMRQHLTRHLRLDGTAQLTIKHTYDQGGTVKINSIVLSEDRLQEPWSGTYFKGIPLSITAIPSQGYRFVGWKGDVTSKDSTITVTMTNELSVTPVFELK